MITDWPYHGTWGDPNTPDAAEIFIPLVGAWMSPVIDVSEGVEQLGYVTHGYLQWNDRLPKGSAIVCDVLVNETEPWQRNLVRGTPIERAEEWNFVEQPTVRVRLRLYSTAGDITPFSDIQIVKVGVVLSLVGSMAWEPKKGIPITWKEDD